MKIYLILFLFTLFSISCKKKTSSNRKMFDGFWEYSSFNNVDEFKNKTFSIEIFKSNSEVITGQYCSVSRNGRKIDCFKDNDEHNVFGKVVNDTLYVKFKSSWENSSGEAKLYFNKKSDLVWELGKTNGELYLPLKVVLKKEIEN